MSNVTLAGLKLIRSTCAELATSFSASTEGDNNHTETLQRMDIVLARLIAEQSEDTTASSTLKQTAQQISDLPETQQSLNQADVLNAINADQKNWQDYSARVQTALKPEPTSTKQLKNNQFDSEVFQAYLRNTFSNETKVEIIQTSTASLGFSKKTVFVNLKNNQTLPSELAIRIDQPFNFLGTTVLDEYPVLEQLWKHGVCVPQPLSLEATGKILGQPFIVFTRSEGSPIGSNFTSPEKNESVVADLARHLAKLHAVPIENSGIAQEKTNARENLNQEVDKYYQDWRELDIASPIMEAAFKWINVNRDLAYGPAVVIHNDYNFNNILIHNNHVSAILDWEFVHIGTPAADLAYFYYSAESTASFDLYLEEYVAAGGQRPNKETLNFYILWGQIRLAVMVFQSESGFRKGEFSDIRYGITGALFLPISIQRVVTKLSELIDKSDI